MHVDYIISMTAFFIIIIIIFVVVVVFFVVVFLCVWWFALRRSVYILQIQRRSSIRRVVWHLGARRGWVDGRERIDNEGVVTLCRRFYGYLISLRT